MPPFNYKRFVAKVMIFFAFTSPTIAHEYWLDPKLFEISVGDELIADLRNGENYKGNSQVYLNKFFTRFEVHDGEKSNPITGSNGDQPAMRYNTEKPGLHIITYQSKFESLKFAKWEKFLTYAKNQGLNTLVKRHLARGLPKTYFKEEYARTIKALVKVGHGEGKDRRTGLPYEFVAQENPYTIGADPDKEQYLSVRLYLDEKWQSNRQVLIFQNNGTVTKTKTLTDRLGFVKVPLKGGGKFMLSSVHIFEGDDDSNTKRPEWISYWANLTFALPGADELLKKSASN